MTYEIALILILLVTITLLLAAELLPIDVTALIGLVILVVTGTLEPQQAFSSFSNDIIIILASIFIISGALARSGITDVFASFILGIIKHKNRLAPFLMALVASVSAFFSNTSSTAILLPVTLQIAKKAKLRASQLLMPLAFGSILGGTCTLIGTSTNLASSGLIARLGLEPFSLFEFIVPGLILTVIGILYMSFIAPRLIPQRETENLTQDYLVRDYLAELQIAAKSHAVGKTIGSLHLERLGATPLTLFRDHKKRIAHGNIKLRTGDKIIIKCPKETLLELLDSDQYLLATEIDVTDQEISGDDIGISEFIVMPNSAFVGQTLRQLNLKSRFQVSVLALYRRQQAYPVQIQNTALRAGDVLLLQGEKEKMAGLASTYPNLWGTPASTDMRLSIKKGIYILGTMLAAVLLTALEILPASIAFLSAVILLVLMRCTTMEDAYNSIEWRLLVLIACMSSLGLAMQSTGTASYLAEIVVSTTHGWGLHATLVVLAVLTIILTQPMSNAAAALVVLPVAISAADLLAVDPRPFAIMVTLSASLSFITPLEPASLLVYSSGKYRFMDFVKVGLPLTMIVILVLLVTVPLLWPFSPALSS
ncbi:MAG: SLC13 family permease [Arenicella sp.]|nr:SLC13 family permease [Arenicella sp.]